MPVQFDLQPPNLVASITWGEHISKGAAMPTKVECGSQVSKISGTSTYAYIWHDSELVSGVSPRLL